MIACRLFQPRAGVVSKWPVERSFRTTFVALFLCSASTSQTLLGWGFLVMPPESTEFPWRLRWKLKRSGVTELRTLEGCSLTFERCEKPRDRPCDAESRPEALGICRATHTENSARGSEHGTATPATPAELAAVEFGLACCSSTRSTILSWSARTPSMCRTSWPRWRWSSAAMALHSRVSLQGLPATPSRPPGFCLQAEDTCW
mmetsp:Transcript_14002/g.43978  ORF Transcript_14002/g.43978 Transcript_14002/m.43978 type:complete len:203 (-) Transcript_14002:14-622(-)